MDMLLVPEEVRTKLGDAGSDGLVTMFADAHRIAEESFERRMDQRFELFEERFERRLAHELGVLKFDLLKWSFLFWIGQLAALTAILSAIIPR